MNIADESGNCRICKRHIEVYDQGAADESRYCSAFCAESTAEEKIAFLILRPGEFGVYPCSECGCAIEDEYKLGEHCGSCEPKVESRRRLDLLTKLYESLTDENGDAVFGKLTAAYTGGASVAKLYVDDETRKLLLDIEKEIGR